MVMGKLVLNLFPLFFQQLKGENIMIIDCHSHLNTNSYDFIYHGDLAYADFIKELKDTKISKSIVSINPKIQPFLCPNDCITNCVNKRGIEKCPINCTLKNRHIVSTMDLTHNSYLKLQCNTCGKILYEGIDPLRILNLQLLKISNDFPDLLCPML